MNYRHAFHAGSFADVIKHIVLVRILIYLHEKPAAFRVIDTHAGAGLYDLTGEEASRSGEWLTGIARILQARFTEQTLPLIAPYLDIVRSFNAPPALTTYPGSPLITRALLRPQDRMTVCEVAPVPRKQLIDALRRDTQARVVDLDGWTALPAFVPPNERRGLVLIDPPFEAKDEFERLGDRVAAATAAVKPPGKLLRIEFSVAPQDAADGLATTGLLVVNPPWPLHDELRLLLPELQKPLGQGGAARYRLEFPKA
jgi:23S rRNA (adenine2030-N6)-methyltransferase